VNPGRPQQPEPGHARCTLRLGRDDSDRALRDAASIRDELRRSSKGREAARLVLEAHETRIAAVLTVAAAVDRGKRHAVRPQRDHRRLCRRDAGPAPASWPRSLRSC